MHVREHGNHAEVFQVCKESSKAFKATVAMSEDFPLSVDMLLNVLEVGQLLASIHRKKRCMYSLTDIWRVMQECLCMRSVREQWQVFIP